jgi:DNA-binding transcriptional LysR family regulator
LVTACRNAGFSPRIVHEVGSVASQVAFVSCGQGVALIPATMKKMTPETVIVRPLTEKFCIVTTAVAWNTTRDNPAVEAAVAALLDS